MKYLHICQYTVQCKTVAGENFGEFGKSKLICQYFTPPNLPLKILQSFVLSDDMCLLAYSSTVLDCRGQVLISVQGVVDSLYRKSISKRFVRYFVVTIIDTRLHHINYCYTHAYYMKRHKIFSVTQLLISSTALIIFNK